MLYLDTSLLVAGLTNEVKTLDVQAWLDNQEPAELAISAIVPATINAFTRFKRVYRSCDRPLLYIFRELHGE